LNVTDLVDWDAPINPWTPVNFENKPSTILKNKRSFYFSSGPKCLHEQQSRIPNRHRRFALQEQGRWLALQRLCQHVLDQLLQMRGAQAQGIGRFQDDDQSTHVHVRGLHAPKV
jgi:hypothetical protein